MTNEMPEQIFRSEITALLSNEQLTHLDRILARLAAAEKVCILVGRSLKARRKKGEKGKRVYWWDVAIAIEDWEKLAES